MAIVDKLGRWVQAEASGFQYLAWEIDLPRIDDRFLRSVVYLYQSPTKAKDGAPEGACGFAVGVPSQKVSSASYVYVVTNKHAIDGGCLTLRINRRGSGVQVIETHPDMWTTAKDDDLAVCQPEPDGALDVGYFHPDRLLAEGSDELGPGDEVVLLGRLLGHDGRIRNRPVARF